MDVVSRLETAEALGSILMAFLRQLREPLIPNAYSADCAKLVHGSSDLDFAARAQELAERTEVLVSTVVLARLALS